MSRQKALTTCATVLFLLSSLVALSGAISGSAAEQSAAPLGSPPASPTAAPQAAIDYVFRRVSADADLPQTYLVETFATDNQRLIDKGLRIYDFCSGWRRSVGLVEPLPHDIGALHKWSLAMLYTTRSIDTDKKIKKAGDIANPGAERSMAIPATVVSDLRLERAAIFAYQVRVAVLKARADAHESRQLLELAADRAFIQLVASPFSRTDSELWRFYDAHCPTSG